MISNDIDTENWSNEEENSTLHHMNNIVLIY